MEERHGHVIMLRVGATVVRRWPRRQRCRRAELPSLTATSHSGPAISEMNAARVQPIQRGLVVPAPHITAPVGAGVVRETPGGRGVERAIPALGFGSQKPGLSCSIVQCAVARPTQYSPVRWHTRCQSRLARHMIILKQNTSRDRSGWSRCNPMLIQ
jgi:hypothetical protein